MSTIRQKLTRLKAETMLGQTWKTLAQHISVLSHSFTDGNFFFDAEPSFMLLFLILLINDSFCAGMNSRNGNLCGNTENVLMKTLIKHVLRTFGFGWFAIIVNNCHDCFYIGNPISCHNVTLSLWEINP